MRGSRAPKACAASAATADIGPMPSTKPQNRIRCVSATAATAPSPSRPINARSVVIMAIWPSCVSAIGQASLMVSRSSLRQMAGALASPLTMVPGSDMARHHTGGRGSRKAISIACRADQELVIAVAACDRRRNDACDTPALAGHEGCDVVTDRRMSLRIANHALFQMLAATFELRLDQRNEPGGRTQ